MSEEALTEARRPSARATARIGVAAPNGTTLASMEDATVASILKPDVVSHPGGIRSLAVCKPRKLAKLEAREIARFFPEVDPGVMPTGSNVLVQIRRAPTTSASGKIQLVAETQEALKWNEMTGRVIAMGPLAYTNPNTGEKFQEGDWCVPGDFVRIPKYGGDRIEVALAAADPALFVIVKDREVFAKIHTNPLTFKVAL